MKKKKSKPFLSAETRQAIDERKETSDKINSTRSERIKRRLRVEYTLKDREVKRRARQEEMAGRGRLKCTKISREWWMENVE